jgi:hypothetical protein
MPDLTLQMTGGLLYEGSRAVVRLLPASNLDCHGFTLARYMVHSVQSHVELRQLVQANVLPELAHRCHCDIVYFAKGPWTWLERGYCRLDVLSCGLFDEFPWVT